MQEMQKMLSMSGSDAGFNMNSLASLLMFFCVRINWSVYYDGQEDIEAR